MGPSWYYHSVKLGVNEIYVYLILEHDIILISQYLYFQWTIDNTTNTWDPAGTTTPWNFRLMANKRRHFTTQTSRIEALPPDIVFCHKDDTFFFCCSTNLLEIESTDSKLPSIEQAKLELGRLCCSKRENKECQSEKQYFHPYFIMWNRTNE